MAATHEPNSTIPAVPVLYLAFELGWNSWKLATAIGVGQKPRLRTIPARSLDAVLAEIKAAKKRLGLPEDAPVVSCYEAGRDGFWLHRFLQTQHVGNIVAAASRMTAASASRNPPSRTTWPPAGTSPTPSPKAQPAERSTVLALH